MVRPLIIDVVVGLMLLPFDTSLVGIVGFIPFLGLAGLIAIPWGLLGDWSHRSGRALPERWRWREEWSPWLGAPAGWVCQGFHSSLSVAAGRELVPHLRRLAR